MQKAPPLTPESFARYPEQARQIAIGRIGLLRQLPRAFVPLLLRELIVYDWKFPAERRELDGQFAYLSGLPPEQLAQEMAAFSALRLAEALSKWDWVNDPAGFTEQLTAHLWKTHQIDAFRTAAMDYVAESTAALPEEPLPMHRLGIAVIGQGVRNNQYRLFRKLRPEGTYFTQVRQTNGVAALTELLARRAAANPLPYGHWYIEGGGANPDLPGVSCVSYGALSPARAALQSRMRSIYEAGVFDPEAFRTRMAQLKPGEIGLDKPGDPVLNRFQLSVLTEGSGTQVFATSFVQWAAREAFRRAQPLTLLARFAPRQRENSMNELLTEAQRRPELDPEGSLIDGDMGAWYNWVNLQRLPGAEKAAFLVWFEDQREALAIGGGLIRGAQFDRQIQLADLAAQVG